MQRNAKWGRETDCKRVRKITGKRHNRMKRTVEQKNVGRRSGRRERARGANNDPEEKHANIFRKRPAISSSILHHIRECWSRRVFESPGVL